MYIVRVYAMYKYYVQCTLYNVNVHTGTWYVLVHRTITYVQLLLNLLQMNPPPKVDALRARFPIRRFHTMKISDWLGRPGSRLDQRSRANRAKRANRLSQPV